MSLAETAKLLLVSFDSTLKSNLSVGLPLDLLFYEKDAFKVGLKKRIGKDDQYYRTVSDGWSNALKAAFASLPDFPVSAERGARAAISAWVSSEQARVSFSIIRRKNESGRMPCICRRAMPRSSRWRRTMAACWSTIWPAISR